MIFQTMNSVGSDSMSVKYQRPTLSGCEDIDIRKFDFVAKIQFKKFKKDGCLPVLYLVMISFPPSSIGIGPTIHSNSRLDESL